MPPECSISCWVDGQWTCFEFEQFGWRKGNIQTFLILPGEIAVVHLCSSLDHKTRFPLQFEADLNPQFRPLRVVVWVSLSWKTLPVGAVWINVWETKLCLGIPPHCVSATVSAVTVQTNSYVTVISTPSIEAHTPLGGWSGTKLGPSRSFSLHLTVWNLLFNQKKNSVLGKDV